MQTKRTLLLLLLPWLTLTTLQAALTPDREYYLWLNIYEKLIGDNATASAPALSAFGVSSDADSYVFIAEDAGKSGYVLLRQKSSGKYLAASGSNSYSVVFESERSTADRYCWQTDEGLYVSIINKKSGKRLGIDGAQKNKDYVAFYYDKPKGSHAQFSVIPATGTWDESRRAYVSPEYVNAQGVKEIDYCQLHALKINRSDSIDIHITANSIPITGSASSVNLGSDHTWLIFDNITPSDVSNNYLKYVTINGKKAVNGTNCRIAIYLNGAAVIPTNGKRVMTYSGTDGDGNLNSGNNKTLSGKNNTMTAFKLQRGYMATLATDINGKGYSRVYVADHADLEVTLPEALAKRVSSVNIKPWQYLSKKGWADTDGATKGSDLRASWYWSWSAGYESTMDMEYVPCRQHKYWPSKDEVNSKTSSAAFSVNEPEHSEQHTSDKCNCGGTVDSWYCTTITPDFLEGGGRIGAPQPTDFSWMNDYFGHADDMAYRCDFAVTHAYWDISGRTESSYADWFVSHCKEAWNSTGRPLWITELEIGSSWGEKVEDYDKYCKYLLVLLQKMEESDWIERYAIYDYDVYQCFMYYRDSNWKRTSLTPAGQVYRDHRSTFAYNSKYTKVPLWWAPSAKRPSLETTQNATTGKFNFSVTNPNGDMTDELYVERLMADGTWQEVARVDSRSRFDNEKVNINTVTVEGASIENDQFRVTVKTLRGKVVSSTAGFIANPEIEASSKTNVDGWTLTKEASAGYTKAESGDTYLEAWNGTAANMNFNYYQDLKDIPAGLYRLTANVFNCVNNEAGGQVNGAVGLYAASSQQFYFGPVTEDAQLPNDAANLNDVAPVTIENILVPEDGKLRIGVRNLGTMQARWAGADNFTLQRTGDLPKDTERALYAADIALYELMPALMNIEVTDQRDATRFLVNPDCNNKSSYGWTTSNVDIKTDAESYDVTATNPYWNIWKGSAFNSSMSQKLTNLPAGTYTFSALLRGENTASMTLAITDGTKTEQQAFTGLGATTTEGDPYPNGWRLVTTAPIQITHGQEVTVSLKAQTSAAGWWSADHFQLTLTAPDPMTVGVDTPSITRTAQSSTYYDLFGRRVNGKALKRGLYIVNGKKVLMK